MRVDHRWTSAAGVAVAVSACVVSCTAEKPSGRRVPPQPTARSSAPTFDPDVHQCLALLAGKDPKARAHGAARLARMGPPARSAVPALVEALSDPEFEVRKIVLLALHEMGPEASSAVPALTAMLQRSESGLQAVVGMTLKRIQKPQRVQDAIRRLADKDAAAAYGAAADLRAEAPDALEAVPALMEALKHESPTVRRGAVQALARIGPIDVGMIRAFDGLEQDTDEDVRKAVEAAEGIFGLTLLAWTQLNEGKTDEAIERLEALARHDPLYAQAPQRLGWAYLVKGDADRSVEWFDKALVLVPRHAESCYGRGKAHHLRGEPADALADFNRALYFDPGLKGAYVDRAALHSAEKRYELAAEDIRQSLRLSPEPTEDSDAHTQLAYIYSMTKNHEQALTEASLALELDTGNAAALYYTALAHEALGHKTEAANAYRQFATRPLPHRFNSLLDARQRVRRQLGIE